MRDDMNQGTRPNEQPDDEPRDAVIDRVAATLGALPPVNPAATARILAAVEARRQERAASPAALHSAPAAPATDVVDLDAARRERRGASWGVHRYTVRALAGVGLAAAVGGFMVRGLVAPGGLRVADAPADTAPMVAVASGDAPESAAQGIVPVANDALTRRLMEESARYEVPFLLAAPGARRVSVVGDFNGWDPAATPLVQDRSGVWTTLVPMRAGRHSYAFLVDDGVWTLDPRAPRATDPDLGTQHSVLLVGAP